MPNWLYLITNLVYHLGLALWIGGAVVLGVLVAPALFRTLPRADAGAIFGPTLRKFTRLRLDALVATIVAAGVKHAMWERAATVWIALRWAALFVMAATVVYEIASLEPSLEARRVHLTPDMAEDHPERQAFQRLHKRAEVLMKLGVAAAVVAMLLS